MPDRFPSSRDKFQTAIRLPPHDLRLDEEKFLRLLANCMSLYPHEKRIVIEKFPKFSQFQVDELIAEFEHELREQELRNITQHGRRERFEREKAKRLKEWREMEREMRS